MPDSTNPAGGPALLDALPAVETSAKAARGPAMKFAYATGSRPLDGYNIKRGVGVGGFGEVYFATTDAGKEVALKRVQRNLDIELRGVSTCLNLKHPHLVALYDIKHDAEGQAWVIMEYVNGESLKDVIDRNPNGLPLDDIREWFTGIAAGVAYLHDHGIVHRDLKPGNLFFDEGIVKVGDYGLSKFISCSHRNGQTESVGTCHYMAPEIGRGSYGREIDLYALGIVLYEMLTGRVPFDGESSQEIIMKHLTTAVDVRGLSQPFATVIAKAMMKDPAHRYREVGDMLTALGWRTGAAHFSSHHSAVVTATISAKSAAEAPFEINDNTTPPGTMFIGDEPEEMEFGEVRQKPANNGARQAIPPRQPLTPPARPTNTQRRPSTPAITYVEPREPIAAALANACKGIGVWCSDSHVGTPLKVAVMLAIGVALVFNATWLVPLAIGAGVLYAVYYGIWSTLAVWNEPIASPTPSQTSSGRTNHFRRRKWQDAAREMLRNRAPSEKFAELTGSLLMAAFSSIVLATVMLVIGSKHFTSTVDTYAFFAWFAVVSTLGSWSVLAIGRVMHPKSGEAVRRRFTWLVLGLALGGAAFGVQELLMVQPQNVLPLPHITDGATSAGAYSSQHVPLAAAYLAYFTGIFVVLRWWQQVDPLRTTRLSIWTTGVCVLWAAVLEMFWHFPQPWGLMLVASISIAAQLSAPWLNQHERNKLREQANALPARH